MSEAKRRGAAAEADEDAERPTERRRSKTMSRKEMARDLRRRRLHRRGGPGGGRSCSSRSTSQRPKTRADCINGPRPCLFVSCKHNLYLDVNPETGSIKLNFPDKEIWELRAHLRARRGGEGRHHARGGGGDHEPHPRAHPPGRDPRAAEAARGHRGRADRATPRALSAGRASTPRRSDAPARRVDTRRRAVATTASPPSTIARSHAVLALLSVSDKRGLVPFAQGLVELGFELLSTGGTLEALKAAGVPATQGLRAHRRPEILDGRVKTLHPQIHGGLLGRPDARERPRRDGAARHRADLAGGGEPLPVPRDGREGRRARPRSSRTSTSAGRRWCAPAAKNSAHVAVVVDPADYDAGAGGAARQRRRLAEATRRRLMRKAFAHTAAYDAAIAALAGRAQAASRSPTSSSLVVPEGAGAALRREPAPARRLLPRARARRPEPTVAFAEVLQGKELSYNNLLDLDAALALVLEFPEQPGAVIIKHNTPVRRGAWTTRWRRPTARARAVDEVSAFGGIVALNREVDEATARGAGRDLPRGVIAPGYSAAARAGAGGEEEPAPAHAGAALAAQARPRAAAGAAQRRRRPAGAGPRRASSPPPSGRW